MAYPINAPMTKKSTIDSAACIALSQGRPRNDRDLMLTALARSTGRPSIYAEISAKVTRSRSFLMRSARTAPTKESAQKNATSSKVDMVWEVSQPRANLHRKPNRCGKRQQKANPHKYSRTPDGLNIAVDSFLHDFNISFNGFIQGHPEPLGKEKQTLNIGVHFAVFPT